MKTIMTAIALVFAAGLATAAPAAAQQAQPAAQDSATLKTHSPKVTGAAGKALGDLQNAINKNDTASIPAKLAAAKAVASTPDDKYAVGILQLKAAGMAHDQAGIAAGLEEMQASGSVKPDEEAGLYNALGQTYSNLKQYDKAADAYQHVLQLEPNNVEAIGSVADARIAAGQPTAALPLLQKGIQMQETNGQKAPEAWYKSAVSVAYGAKMPEAPELARQWVAAYPTTDNWRNAIAVFRNLDQPDVEGTLDILRLENAVGALSSPSDYALFAESAAQQLNYNEAKAILDKGISANVVHASDPAFRDLIAGLQTKGKATDADLTQALTMAKDAKAFVGIGDRFASMGEYAKAADAYRSAMSKPGADASLINLHLGMALARQGDKAGATTALKAVSGPLSEVAKFWLTYADTKA